MTSVKKPLRVLHGPVNVGNQPWVLSRNERAQGIQSDLVVNYGTWLGYPADRIISECANRTAGSLLRRTAFGITAPFRYDVLHYYFGRSYFCWDDYGAPNRAWFLDLKLAKKLGKKIFFTLQGCDARLSRQSAEINRFTPCKEGHCQAVPVCRSQLDQQRKYLIDVILPLADRVFVLNPELVRYVPNAVFLPYASVDIDGIQVTLPEVGAKLKIVHAPSDPAIKGSQYIIKAIESLGKKYQIDFIQVKGIPHQEALKIYQHADLIIDQALAGWYGGFAVEAMAMGKPVACYVREEDLGFIPKAMACDLPVIRISPETLEFDLETAIENSQRWREIGCQSREFVTRWHHPRRISESMIRAYHDPASRFSHG